MTGKKDKTLEYIVTAVLMVANIGIGVAMVGAYLHASVLQRRVANNAFVKFVEERDEPFGGVTLHANPHAPHPARLEVFKTLADALVYTLPMLSSEQTGEIMECGQEAVIASSRSEYVRATCG